MRDKSKAGGWKYAAGALAAFVVAGAAGLVTVYTGAYNVAATEEHTSFVRWAFDTTFRHSVERRSSDSDPPERISPSMVEAGGRAYKSMCEHCHGGPGAKRAEWASGMRPRPPHLAEAAEHWALNDVFWIAKHGVRMTGMPAFGPTHDDNALWGIAGFVKALPAMTPEVYAALGDAGPDHGGGDESRQAHASGHGHGDGTGATGASHSPR